MEFDLTSASHDVVALYLLSRFVMFTMKHCACNNDSLYVHYRSVVNDYKCNTITCNVNVISLKSI